MSADRPIQRPPNVRGTLGRKILLVANFFRMAVSKGLRVLVHPVEIKREVFVVAKRHGETERAHRSTPGAQRQWLDVTKTQPVPWNRNVFNAFMQNQRDALQRSVLAYDGRSIAFSPIKLPFDALNTDIELVVDADGHAVGRDNRDAPAHETVRVRLQSASRELDFANYLRLGNAYREGRQEFQTVLDIALAHCPAQSHVMVGRSFYNSNETKDLGRFNKSAEAWRGFYQSVRFTESGPVVNLDESYTPFWSAGGQPLHRLVYLANSNKELSSNNQQDLRKVSRTLKFVKVRAYHTGITCKVHEFSQRTPETHVFDYEGRQMSVREYFKDKYNIDLRYPHSPLVLVKRDTYVPMEMLFVLKDQRMTGLLSPEQTSHIVQAASTTPQDRMNFAKEKMRALNRTRDAVRDGFGVKVDDDLMRLHGRVLPPPEIEFQPEKRMKPKEGEGVWSHPERCSFRSPIKLEHWAFVNNSSYSNDREFLNQFRQAASRVGMPCNEPIHLRENKNEWVGTTLKKIEKELQKRSRQKPQLIMIMQEFQDSKAYNEIKRFGDLEIGVVTQVVVKKTVSLLENKGYRRFSTYFNNLLLKVNTKLGGMNSAVVPFQFCRNPPVRDPAFVHRPHIVLGADVTHPGAGANTCSVAALVGSRDRAGVQFSASIRNQQMRQEIIGDLGNMFMEVYRPWYFTRGQKEHAQAIIMFRDGVSESQYEQVLANELRALRRACEHVGERTGKPFRPRITYVIVTKRHHTRFAYADRPVRQNIPAGTVVDGTVTSADYFDFYLNSHAGLLGTSKPSKYVVLLDENNIGVDELQGYVYRLSHGFARCNRSVSMVTSAYYAHLLAFRARAYLDQSGSGSSSEGGRPDVAQTVRINPELQKRLYFV